MSHPSHVAKRMILAIVVEDCEQTAKVIIDPTKLTDGHGIPETVISRYASGIPLNLNPSYPMELELLDEGLCVVLSFGGRPSACFIPWAAVGVIAVGVAGAAWEHEGEGEPVKTVPPIPDGGGEVIAGPWGK